MPYRFYFGKTGRVWNVNKRSVGVEMLKTVSNRKRTKRFHIRIEHIRPSKCIDKFKNRVKGNEAYKAEVRAGKEQRKTHETISHPHRTHPTFQMH